MSDERFALRFPATEIPKWAAQYRYPGEDDLIAGPVKAARQRGYLQYEEFVQIGDWKSERQRRRYRRNEPQLVEEISRIALGQRTSPRLSIEILTLLQGVGWPTGSVILHFCHSEPYPILDFRALWSLGCSVPKTYEYTFWRSYADFTRELAARCGCDMRTLDRALWQYSSANQDGE